MKEEWRVIKDFTDYEISNLGNVRRCTSSNNWHIGKVLQQTLNNCGYYCVTLRKNKKSYCKTIHRLVANAYIPNPNNYSDVDHIDRNKTNNIISNLRWLSHKDNMHNQDRSIAIKKQKETCRIKRDLKKLIPKEKTIKYTYWEIDGKQYKTLREFANITKKTYNAVKYYIWKNNIVQKFKYKKIIYF